MTHPQKAVAILHDVADRLTVIGVDDIVNVRLRSPLGTDYGATMTVRIEVHTQEAVDLAAAEFGLPAVGPNRCGSCGADHGDARVYRRSIESARDGQFILASDDVSNYVVMEVHCDRDPAAVVPAAAAARALHVGASS